MRSATDPAAFSILPPAGTGGAAAQPELLVRIYPDAIHQDSHEPELTPSELAWQGEFRKRIHRSGTPIKARLMDQGAISGIGNDFQASSKSVAAASKFCAA